MPFEQRDNSGQLFKNDKKTSDNHPGWKGEAMIGGVSYWISCWVKPTRDGGKWQSLAFTPKDDRQNTTEPQKQSAPAEFDDKLPF